ncbi:MAG: response regulator transcription factor [Verrucomicrobiota bacterium]|nr:response regulator transcription factor [Verrucomicrobiota bacterium]
MRDMKVLIADDHAVVRRGLREILEDNFEEPIVGEAASTAETMDAIRREHWDIVLLDVTMPGRGGLEVLKDLRVTRPKLPVLVLTVHPVEQYGMRALKAGAAGYVTKETAPEELVAAVKKVLSGSRYVPPALGETIAASIAEPSGPAPHEALADREFQVLCMLASGKTIKQIAIELSLSPKTISTYRARVLEKLNLRCTAELVRYGQQHGLAE